MAKRQGKRQGMWVFDPNAAQKNSAPTASKKVRSAKKLKPVQFELKIELLDSPLDIWRRVIVPADLTLRELHGVIQAVMGWREAHMHEFQMGEEEIYHMPIPEDPFEDFTGTKKKDERKFKLSTILSGNQKFLYWYDFGDDWYHRITVERLIFEDEIVPIYLPECLAGKNACPPEDCGGVYGYEEILEGMKSGELDPDLKEWLGEFDPYSFNVSQANQAIALTCALYNARKWGFRKIYDFAGF